MYLKKKFILLIAVFTFLGFLSCETPTNHQNETTTYNKSIKLDNKNKNNNTLSSQILNEEKDTAQREFLNIALMLPLSGKHYQIGNSLLNSAQLALEKKNNKKIKFTIIDTGDEEQLLSRLYRVLEDEIDIIIGPVFSDKVNQVREITKNKAIPIIALSNNSEIQDNRLYVFGLKLEDEIKELLTYSINRNLKKYAVLVPRNEFGSRVEKEIKQFQSKNNLSSFVFNFYNPDSPDFYDVSKNVSNFEVRKTNLEKKIKLLERENSEKAKEELKKLKKLDTYGELNFEALIIFAQNFQEVSNFSSILPYYDVDPKKVQYIGSSLWAKNLSLKEPGLENGYFTSLDIDNQKKFENMYLEIFNSKPHPLATLSYDIVGLISNLHQDKNNFTIKKLHNSNGFIGMNGWFKMTSDGNVLRQPKIYKIKKQKFSLLN
jgi:hypothetical protein